MKLTENMTWPPLQSAVRTSLSEWDAWWTGDKGRLDTVYTDVHPSQRLGGIVGWSARRLWGNPPRDREDTRIHLPLAADIATASSDLLFGEELSIDYGEGNSALGERMDEILDGVAWTTQLSEAGEIASALGGVCLRAGWDTEVADHPLMSVVSPDGALPVFSFGVLKEITFWFVDATDTVVWRHTETHEPGRIVHRLWKGTSSSLGVSVPLLDHPMTEGLAASLSAEDYILTGTDALTAVYIPNIRPVPQWRRISDAAYLGRSDFGVLGTLGIFNAIDETWTSWLRDIRHGRSRLFASDLLMRDRGPGKGLEFDLDREVFELVKLPAPEDPSIDKMISAQQFAIRVEEHSRTIREATLAAVSSCGYSGSTFGLDNEVAKTATEVGAVRDRTRNTRSKKIRYWTPQLERFVFALSELDRTIFNNPGFGDDPPKISFPAFSAPSGLELAQTALALKSAQAASTETLVRMVNPDWDDLQVAAEVALILDESKPAPLEIGGDPFGTETPVGEEPEEPEEPLFPEEA